MNNALRSLREARGELSAEAKWLREKLSPGRMVHRTVDNHTSAVLAIAFAVGLAGSWLIFHKPRQQPIRKVTREFEQQRRSKPGIGVALLKAALPFVLKYATSKPAITKLFEMATARRARPARYAVT